MPESKTAHAVRNKKERVEARITARDKALLKRAAALTGRSLSSFVADAAQQAAERTLGGVETMVLGPEDTEVFLRALEAPPEPNERLRRLARRYWVRDESTR